MSSSFSTQPRPIAKEAICSFFSSYPHHAGTESTKDFYTISCVNPPLIVRMINDMTVPSERTQKFSTLITATGPRYCLGWESWRVYLRDLISL